VSRYKYDYWHRFEVDRFQNRESIQFGHLYVEKDKVGYFFLNFRYGLTAICTLPENLDLRLVSEQLPQALARQQFVIGDQRYALSLR